MNVKIKDVRVPGAVTGCVVVVVVAGVVVVVEVEMVVGAETGDNQSALTW